MPYLTFIVLKKDRLVAETIARALEGNGYKSLGCFTQSIDALKAVLTNDPDYFLTETDLLDTNGYQIIRQAKQYN